MKLQLALDMLDKETAITILRQTAEFIDVIELGTPLVKAEGLRTLLPLRKL